MKISPLAIKIAEALTKLKKETNPAAPKGLPENSVNSNKTTDGVYEQEDLTEPLIQNPVTGSGNGPVIGRRGRAAGGSV